MQVRIEQRLQDFPRVLILPADEAFFLGLPFVMGLFGRKVLLGIFIAFIAWSLWKRLKGEGGIERILASLYWFLPISLKVFGDLPDSSVQTWEG